LAPWTENIVEKETLLSNNTDSFVHVTAFSQLVIATMLNFPYSVTIQLKGQIGYPQLKDNKSVNVLFGQDCDISEGGKGNPNL
jgi:hypothetical protein